MTSLGYGNEISLELISPTTGGSRRNRSSTTSRCIHEPFSQCSSSSSSSSRSSVCNAGSDTISCSISSSNVLSIPPEWLATALPTDKEFHRWIKNQPQQQHQNQRHPQKPYYNRSLSDDSLNSNCSNASSNSSESCLGRPLEDSWKFASNLLGIKRKQTPLEWLEKYHNQKMEGLQSYELAEL